MPLAKLQLMPDEAGYSGQYGDGFAFTKLDGGRGRRRRAFIGSSRTVSCQFSLSPASFAYMVAFWRTTISEGAVTFLIDLMLDGQIAEYEAGVLPGSFQLGGVRGNQRQVQMQLEVVPMPTDSDYDAALALWFDTFGEDGSTALDILDEMMLEIAPTI